MNINNSILLIDPTFDASMTPACSLLVKIGIDSFSYAIINKSTEQVIALYDEQECNISQLNLTERFEKNSYLSLPYQQTKIAIYTNDEISIPNDIFDETSVESHSKLMKNNTVIHLFQQNHFGFTTIFGLDKSLQDILTSQLSNLKMYSHNAGLLAIAEDSKNDQLFLNFSVNSFTALFIKDQKVIFQKCYETENIEELNYFILLLIHQLNILTTEVTIRLSGIINENDSKHLCLQKYFNIIEFVKLDTELSLQILEEMPAHYYINLLALDQCV
ncbi:MAG: DUF3822 family protein [Sphingobacteriaceae bacterium]|nr:DUF3822 family protein [Sphingobacteriaceae bacterium]